MQIMLAHTIAMQIKSHTNSQAGPLMGLQCHQYHRMSSQGFDGP